VEGCLRWQRRGHLETPPAVRQASAMYRSEQDTFQEFLRDVCEEADPSAEVTCGELYKAYSDWCQSNAERPLSLPLFGRSLDQRGFQTRRGGGGTRFRVGLKLVTPVTPVTQVTPDRPSSPGV
jgi:putative DNA primase/helicase